MIVGKTLLLVLVLCWTLGILAQQSNANVAISKNSEGGAEVTEAIANENKRMLQAATNVPTAAPTTKNPTRSPSRKPTNRPTLRKSIYGDYMPDELLEYSDQQDTVIVLIIAIFVLMAFEVAAPEVIMLTALMIVVYCEILTLSEGLAGKSWFVLFFSPSSLQQSNFISFFLLYRIFQHGVDYNWRSLPGGGCSGEISRD